MMFREVIGSIIGPFIPVSSELFLLLRSFAQ